MKIVHLSHLYHPSEGGVQFFFKNISERLVKEYGDDVTVVTTNSMLGPERRTFKKVEPANEVINGVKVKRFSYSRWQHKVLPLMFKVLAKLSVKAPEWLVQMANGPYSKAMKQYLLNVDADVFCGSSSNYYYMQLPLWRKCKFFYYGSIHLNHNESKQALLTSQLQSIKASELYLANTIYEKNCMIRMGVPKEKVFVLGTGVEMADLNANDKAVKSYRSKLGLTDNDILIGYVGRIERTKNVKILVESFEQIAKNYSNAHLLIAGSGNEHVEELQKIVADYPKATQQKIHWEIKFAADTKPLIFNSLDIFVLPSNNESFGIVFLEAWSCKKPVIGSAIGAVKDVIAENIDGLLMEPDNVKSLVEKIAVLIENKALRNTMGNNGYNKVSDNYTWDIITARLRKCYQNSMEEVSYKTLKQLANV